MPLLVRSAIAALLWLYAPSWVFVLFAFYFYFNPFFQPWKILASFLVFLALTLLAPSFSGFWWYGEALLVGAAFYLILGVKDLVIVDRQAAYQILRTGLLLVIFTLFFWWGQSQDASFLWRLLLLFASLFFLYREYFSSVLEQESSRTFLAAFSTLFLFETAWILSWLPIGFLNATAITILAAFMLNDFILHHYKRNLSRKILLTNFTVFLFSLLIIFLFSDWSIR